MDAATGKYLSATCQAESKNVGAGGMLLATDEKLEPGTILEFETMLESDQGQVSRRVIASGEVLETSPAGSDGGPEYLVRLKVTTMNPEDRELLARSVQRRIGAQ